MTAREPSPLMTPAEVAWLFQVAPTTVTRWARAGKLRSIRTLARTTGHGHRRYYRAEVEALAAGKPLTGAQLDALTGGSREERTS